MLNCNICKHISITEEEQHKQSVKTPHICNKYKIRLLHGNQHIGEDDFIQPCGQCLKEYENHSTEIYCQGTKKKGIPCKRYLGKLHSGKVELLCPICKTVNVVEDGEVNIKEKGE